MTNVYLISFFQNFKNASLQIDDDVVKFFCRRHFCRFGKRRRRSGTE